MPTSTFFRLPEEKRARLTEAAWEEFTQVSYTDASINKIVQKARIPRGSFYQYFSDKEDLFRYLLTGTQHYFADVVVQLLDKAKGDLFAFPLFTFDRYAPTDISPDRQVDRFVQVIRRNVGMDFQRFFLEPQRLLPDSMIEHVDLSRFRSREEPFIRQVIFLLLLCTATAIVDTLNWPERREQQRSFLQERVNILAKGALMPDLSSQ